MGLTKFGQGDVLPDDNSKTASSETDEDRQQRLENLQEENEEKDK